MSNVVPFPTSSRLAFRVAQQAAAQATHFPAPDRATPRDRDQAWNRLFTCSDAEYPAALAAYEAMC